MTDYVAGYVPSNKLGLYLIFVAYGDEDSKFAILNRRREE
jgi:hypothetical protein